MKNKETIKKAVGYLSHQPLRSYTWHDVMTDRTNSRYIESLAMPLNRGGRAAERLVSLGGAAVAAFALASAPITFPAVATTLGYMAVAKVAGIFTGAIVDNKIEKTRKGMKL